MKLKIILFSLLSIFILPIVCRAMPIGTLLYRTTNDGKMYGNTSSELIEVENGIMKAIMPGHVGIYIGEENGEHYVVEALSIGVVKTPLDKFINTSLGEDLVGARIPKDISEVERAKAVVLARTIAEANLGYDFDFKKQKGPKSGEWTCVGLVEKVYESSSVLNPYDLDNLVYDQNNYGMNITPDGFDDYSVYNERGDCFSKDKEFSSIAAREDSILPFPENGGYNAGLIKDGKRYIFLPYTQYLQDSLEDVVVDRNVSSSFNDEEVRGSVKASALVIRWSLINNPVSRIKMAFSEVKDKVIGIGSKIAGFITGDGDLELEEIKMNALANEMGNEDDNIHSDKDSLSKIAGLEIQVRDEILLPDGKEIEMIENPKKIGINYEEVIEEMEVITSINDINEIEEESSIKETEDFDLRESINTGSDFFKNSLELEIEEEEYLSEIDSYEIEEDSGNINNLDLAVEKDKTIYISKIYANSNNEFVELYNPNHYALDLKEENYRLEKSLTATDPSLLFRIGNDDDGTYPGGTIIPGLGYYLIVNSDASSYLKNKADALVTRSNFSLNNKKQSLFLGTAAISSYDDEDIVDLVAYGAEAKYYLGNGPAPEIINYHFLNRISYNLDNSIDFNLLLSADPEAISAWQEENQSNVPGADDDYEDNYEEDEEENENLEIIQNGISKLYIEAVGAEGDNDFIKLKNKSSYDIDLAKFSIRLEKAKTGVDPSILVRIGEITDAAYPGGTTVKKGESYLIVNDSADDYLLNLADAIVVRDNFIITPSEQSIYLGVSAISSPSDEDIIDLLGFGAEASYYSGSAPALSIEDNMVLKRQSYTSENYYDYVLESKYTYFNLEEVEEEEDEDGDDVEEEVEEEEDEDGDDEVVEEIEEEEDIIEDEGEDNNNVASLPNIIDNYTDGYDFSLSDAYNSDGIVYLNHFNNCSMLFGPSAIGKWSCGKELGKYGGNYIDEFSNSVNLNSFSLGVFYHYVSALPSVGFTLMNMNEELGISFEPNKITLSGLLGDEIFYLAGPSFMEDESFVNNWHYLNLIIDKSNNLLKILNDGVEIFSLDISGVNLFSAEQIVLMGGETSTYFDELSVWDRVLSNNEIISYINSEQEFYPLSNKRESLDKKLIYEWNFNNDLENYSLDRINGQKLEYFPGKNIDGSLEISEQAAEIYLPDYISSRDFSFSFWSKNNSYPDDGEIVLSIMDRSECCDSEKFTFIATSYERGVAMKYSYYPLSNGLNQNYPYDNFWHHIVISYDSVEFKFKLYVDKILESELDLSPYAQSEGKFNLIKIESGFSTSLIDDLKMYSGVLSEANISNLYSIR